MMRSATANLPGSRLLSSVLLPLLLVATTTVVVAQEPPFPLSAKRILFLGDSITHAGTYVAMIEAQLRAHRIEPLPDIINLGLSSETCSGLSEPAHPFPRPDVHERLERALEQLDPDVVVACYGMNDGIYHPFSEERFAAYRAGIERLIEKVAAHGAQLILLTPPPFDPVPLRAGGQLRPADADEFAYFAMYEDYDDVLARYADWILTRHDRVAMTIDLRRPILDWLDARRRDAPATTVAPDGIHPNDQGHRLIARAILDAWGLRDEIEVPAEVLASLRRRNAILHDAYLSQVGHRRPDVPAGLPVDEAKRQAEAIDREIAERLTPR